MNYSTTVVSLSREVWGEIEVVTRSIEPKSNDDEGKDDEESSDGDDPQENRKSRGLLLMTFCNSKKKIEFQSS